MSDLCSHANVFNSAVYYLQAKGWKVTVILPERTSSLPYDSEPSESYSGEKDGWVLVADDPIQLLGLVGIHEFVKPKKHKPYWWSHPGEGHPWTELLEKAYDD